MSEDKNTICLLYTSAPAATEQTSAAAGTDTTASAEATTTASGSDLNIMLETPVERCV